MVKRVVFLAALLLAPAGASAQDQPATAPGTVCGQPIPEPRALPPPNSPPVIYQIVPCFEAQGNVSLVDYQTYLYYIQLKSSRPSEGVWINYDDSSEKTMREDFQRLWGTNFLD